ncbi:SusE domain-containing protein [Hymenobacter actinosclerus]|uniref:SusE outer membrane protein n=1 Tax=Hymenobacter actinosclerus TaxID=82805 RepID=A0A1I0BZQ8_9BACT|nr:SusE domain-containing protein [Hymenobacter actinosclerus]SET12566.1 SusE outer membrane protein [Hymenobacter actinosclerus]
MSSLITRLSLGWLALAGLTLTMTSCEKDETKVTLKMSTTPQLTASATTASLAPATANATAVTYTASAGDYGFPAGVKYVLQLAPAGTNFANAQEFPLGADLKKTFTGAELNGVYNAIDCNISTPKPTPLDVRLKATISESVDPVYSNALAIQASPYQAQTAPADTWAIIGSATPKGWDADTPLNYDFCTRTYKAVVKLTTAAGSNEFKFRSNGAWTVNLGDGGAGDASKPEGRQLAYNAEPTPNPPNLSLTEAGTYEVTLNLNSKPKPTFTLIKK